MTANPTITVAMAAYNAAPFLQQAIDSILAQTFTDWELIIINDGSTDNSAEIVMGYSDERIVMLQNATNQGLCACRLQTIAKAKGKYLCFQDADDWSEVDRLAKIVSLFNKDTDLIVCGSDAWIENENKETGTIHNKPYKNDELRTGLLFGFPFISPSLGFCTEYLKKAAQEMPPNIRQAEDYVLLALLWQQGGHMANLAEPLYHYRVHTSAHRITREENNADIVAGRFCAQHIMFSVWNLTPTNELLALHDKLTYYPQRIQELSFAAAAAYCQWWAQVCAANVKQPHVSQAHLAQAVSNAIYKLLLHNALPMGDACRLWWQYGKLLSPSLRAKLMMKRFIQ